MLKEYLQKKLNNSIKIPKKKSEKIHKFFYKNVDVFFRENAKIPEDLGEVTEGDVGAFGDEKTLGEWGKAFGVLEGFTNGLGTTFGFFGANMSKAVNLSDFKDFNAWSLTFATILDDRTF